MRSRSIQMLAMLAALTSVARAQPGQDPAPPPPPDPSPYPAPLDPQPYPPPPQLPQQQQQPEPPPPGYVVQPIAVQLTAEEHALLQRGEISEGQHIGGGMANVFLGFGVGQAIQGRWSEKGWLFTVGGIASVVAIIVGFGQALDDDGDSDIPVTFIAGYLGFLVFHVWGAIDAFVEPGKHNRRVRELKMRLGMPAPYFGHRVLPYVQKSRDGGGTAGLVFRF